MEFNGRVLFVGYGAVAQCALPILLKEAKISPKKVTVMDFEDRSKILAKHIQKGVRFVRDRVTEKNLGTSSSTSPGTSTAASSCSGAGTTASSTSTPRPRSGTPTRAP